MRSVFLLLLATAKLACASELFDVPENWVKLELSNPDPKLARSVEGYSSPGGGILVTVTRFISALHTERDVNEMTRGALRSLEGNGFTHEFTKRIEIRGYPVTHMRCEKPAAAGNSPLALDTYAFFSDETVISVAVITSPAVATREQGAAYLDRVSIPGNPADLRAKDLIPGDSAAERLGYMVGTVVGILIIPVALVIVIVAMVRRAHRSRAKLLAEMQGKA